jgi:hypothetical protein
VTFLSHGIDQCHARVGYPRFGELANGMPRETGDHLVRRQATKRYTEATRACYKKIAVLMGKSSIGSEILEKSSRGTVNSALSLAELFVFLTSLAGHALLLGRHPFCLRCSGRPANHTKSLARTSQEELGQNGGSPPGVSIPRNGYSHRAGI